MKKLPGNQPRNPLGQFGDEVLDAGKSIVKDTAKTVVSQPKKILESILGAPSKDDGDGGIEDVVATSGGSQAQDPQAQQKQRMQKMIQQKQDDQAKVKLHRQRLQEEIQYHQQRKQEKEIEEEQKEVQEEQEEKQIEQVKREKRKEQQSRQIAGRQGSKEQGRGKKF